MLIFWAVWTLLGLFFASKFYVESHTYGRGAAWTKALWWHLMEWYGWAAFSPAIFYTCRKADADRERWWRLAALHLLVGSLISSLLVGVFSLGALVESLVLETGYSWGYLYKVVLIHHFHFNLFVYSAIVSVWYALDYYRKSGERELKTAELEASLSQARLQALKMQIQPHFLFNTLNGIAALNYDDPKGANRMLAKLSDLLRLALENEAEISLRQELTFNQGYLELEQIRLGERLTVNLEIAPETLDARVPSFLLQPLLENAIRHGIAPFSRPGKIRIRAYRVLEHLHIEIADTGPGIHREIDKQSGVGLANTRARLQQIFGDQHRFELTNGPDGGLIVKICIPFRAHPPSEPGHEIQVEYEDSYAHSR